MDAPVPTPDLMKLMAVALAHDAGLCLVADEYARLERGDGRRVVRRVHMGGCAQPITHAELVERAGPDGCRPEARLVGYVVTPERTRLLSVAVDAGYLRASQT